jgi:hypothetical protein
MYAYSTWSDSKEIQEADYKFCSQFTDTHSRTSKHVTKRRTAKSGSNPLF